MKSIRFTLLAIVCLTVLPFTVLAKDQIPLESISVINMMSQAPLINSSHFTIGNFRVISTFRRDWALTAFTLVVESENRVTVEDIFVRKLGDVSPKQEFHDMNFVIPGRNKNEPGTASDFCVYANVKEYAGDFLRVRLKNFIFKDGQGQIYIVSEEVDVIFVR